MSSTVTEVGEIKETDKNQIDIVASTQVRELFENVVNALNNIYHLILPCIDGLNRCLDGRE
jgi:hypothetical protein